MDGSLGGTVYRSLWNSLQSPSLMLSRSRPPDNASRALFFIASLGQLCRYISLSIRILLYQLQIILSLSIHIFLYRRTITLNKFLILPKIIEFSHVEENLTNTENKIHPWVSSWPVWPPSESWGRILMGCISNWTPLVLQFNSLSWWISSCINRLHVDFKYSLNHL